MSRPWERSRARTPFASALVTLASLTLLSSSAADLHAQDPTDDPTDRPGHVGAFAGNALAGALASGVAAWVRGEEFGRAFAWGALGGGVSFSGKWLAARVPEGGGLVGRQLAEMGHSAAVNAAAGEEPWNELWVALGPVRLRVRSSPGDETLPVRVNLYDLARAAGTALQSETRLSLRRTLTTGTLVFHAPDHMLVGRDGEAALGVAMGSVVVISGAGDFDREATLGHEMVHVIQGDLLTRLVTSPAEQGLWGLLGRGSRVARSVELTNGLTMSSLDFMDDLLEAEAQHLDQKQRPGGGEP